MSNAVSESNVLSEIKDQVKWIWFNRPEVRNALVPDSSDAVREHIEKAPAEGARVVVLGGKGGAFCSGADLKAITQMESYSGVRDVLVNCYHPLVMAMAKSPLPIIAAVDGAAAGIGCDISLAADMRLISDRAFFAEIFVNISLIPDGGGTFTLPRLVGLGRALEMAATGCRVPAEQAVAWGLANHVYPADTFEEEVHRFAAALAQKAPLSLARSKQAIRQSMNSGSLEEALALEADLQEELSQSSDFPEGVMAFIEKRPPNFQGK